MTPSLGAQIVELSRRSTLKALRQATIVVPTLVFPLFFLAINAAGLSEATKIKGFPTDSYLTFALGTTFVQASMTGTVTAGGALAEDIQTGFLSRLSLTPMRATALLLGHMAGTVVIAAIGAVIYLVVGLIFGATVEAGVAGAIVIVLLSTFIALAFASIGVLTALRSGNPETVQMVFPLIFVLMFVSSMALPRNLMEKEWFEQVATYNPLSYLIEAVRSLLITGWDGEALALGVGISAAITVGSLALAATQIKRRMLRT